MKLISNYNMYLFALVSKLIIIDGPEKIKLMTKKIHGLLFPIFNPPKKKDSSSLLINSFVNKLFADQCVLE